MAGRTDWRGTHYSACLGAAVAGVGLMTPVHTISAILFVGGLTGVIASILHRAARPITTIALTVASFICLTTATLVFQDHLWAELPRSITLADVRYAQQEARRRIVSGYVDPSENHKIYTSRLPKHFLNVLKAGKRTDIINDRNLNAGMLISFKGFFDSITPMTGFEGVLIVFLKADDGLRVTCFFSDVFQSYLSSLDVGSSVDVTGTISKLTDDNSGPDIDDMTLTGCHPTSPLASSPPSLVLPALPAEKLPRTSP